MNINLKSVIPNPLADVSHPNNSVWGNEIELEKGKNYLINAPSGKGKTTFLNIIYGIRKDYIGDVIINEVKATSLSQNQWSVLRQEKFSMVFQDLRLFANLTSLENIKLKAKISKSEQIYSITEMAKILGVEDLLQKPCKKLSFGQQQRVAIIRALQQPFEWLFLDEPFSHLDQQNIGIVSQLISKVCAANGAGIIATTLGSDYPFKINQTLNI